jgi:hypothetical protein
VFDPNFFDKSISACSFETATLTSNSKSFAWFVLSKIFINSSFVSNENVFIPCLKYASLILSLLLMVCIYEQIEFGLIFLIISISLIDATSKLFIPLSTIVFSTIGFGLVFNA